MQVEKFAHKINKEKDVDCIIFNPKEYSEESRKESMSLFVEFCIENCVYEMQDLFKFGDFRYFIN